MTWEEWEREFPVEEIFIKPVHFIDSSESRITAEKIAENEEMYEDCRTTYKVVKFENTYFVVSND